MFDIQKVDCKPGDVILFLFDHSHYDIPACHEIFKIVEKQLPDNTVIALPKDLVADIKIFNTQPKVIQINGDNYQSELQKYLEPYYNEYTGDATTAVRLEKGWITG